MKSLLKTTVAVLRRELGIGIEEFAEILEKSLSTATKLENGQLPLSEETAQTISKETGVDMRWLLAGEPKEEPYFTDVEYGKQPYTKEVFERVQAAKQKPNPPLDPALYLAVSDIASIPFHMAYAHAEKAGDGQLALYVYRKFLEGFVERFGTDPEEFLRINKDARHTYADGSIRAFASAKALELKELGDVVLTRVGGPVSVRKRDTPKTVPVLDVPVDANSYPDWSAIPSATPNMPRKRTTKAKK
jgi:transcriptional regulator with XRE-family HTH domain